MIFVTKLCRQHAEVITNHGSGNVHNIGRGEARHRQYWRLKLGGGWKYELSNVCQ